MRKPYKLKIISFLHRVICISIQLSIFQEYSNKTNKKIDNFITKTPGSFVFLLSKMKLLYFGHTFFADSGYFNQIDFKYMYFSFQQMYRLIFLFMKIYILDKFSFYQKENELGSIMPKMILPILKAFILFIYNNKKNYKLNKMSYLNIIIVHNIFFLYYKWQIIKIIIYRQKLSITYLAIERMVYLFFNYNKEIINVIIKSIPFTILLFLKYNMEISWVGTIIAMYIIIKLIKIVGIYLIHIWQTFYASAWADHKLRHYTLIPVTLGLNLGSIYGIFYILENYLPTFQFTGILIFTILKHLCLNKLFNLIIYSLYFHFQKFSKMEEFKKFIYSSNFNIYK